MCNNTFNKNYTETFDLNNISSLITSNISILMNNYFYNSDKSINECGTIDNPYDDNIFSRKKVLNQIQIDEINEIADEYGDLIGKILDRL